MINILKEELNVKEIKIIEKIGEDNWKVELDTNITPELEAEGFARELTRAIQAARKKENLIKENLIDLEITFQHKNKKLVEKFINNEKSRIGAKKIDFEQSKNKFNYSEEGKIRQINYKISFNKLINSSTATSLFTFRFTTSFPLYKVIFPGPLPT